MLPLTPKVYCDLNADGDFSDTNEDFSADVYDISWSRGRSSVNEDFGAGTAEVTMKYTNGKYCPFDTTSALYPNLMVGREMKIEAGHQPDPIVNLYTNPSFETDINAVSSPTCTLAQDATEFVYGTKSLKVTYTAGFTEQINFTTQAGDRIPVTEELYYALSLWLKPGTATGLVHIGMVWYDAGGAVIPFPGAPTGHAWGVGFTQGQLITLAAGWTRYWFSAIAPKGAVTARVNLEENTGLGAGETLFIDGVMFAQYEGDPGYIDGAQTNCSWDGTAHASTSRVGTTTYPVFRGRISDIHQVDDSIGGNPPSVVISLQEDFARMSRSRYRSPASMLAGGTVSSILASILTDFGVAGGMQDLDTSVQSVVAFWQQSGSHLDAAKSIVHQELGGAYYIARDGKHTFENREARSLAAVHATFIGPQVLAMDLRESDWIDQVVFKRAGLDVGTATEVIYNLFPTGRALASSSTDPQNTFHGDYIASAKNVVQPVPGLDYFANTLADGSGADVTNQVSVSAWASYGGGFEITMNNASGATAYLTSFVVRGQAIRQSDTTREITVSDASAPVQNQALRDEFAFNDDVDAIKGYAQFKLFAGSTFYARNMQVHLEPQSDADIVSLLGMELGKRLHIQNTTGLYATTIDADYFVEAISGRFVGPLVQLDCTLWHELAALGSFFRISGTVASGHDYSTIVAAGATAGDRIRF